MLKQGKHPRAHGRACTLSAWLIFLAWLAVMVLGGVLRWDGLAERPVHADEATGARILAQQLEGQGYAYNPRHFHGPTLSHITYPLARLRGEDDWTALQIRTLRSSTVVGGLLLVLTPLLWLRVLGPWATLAAAALLATSPLFVYYSRVFIHETWFAFFGMLACAGTYQVLRKPRPAKALATGIAIGLMFATKITVAISLLSWAVAAVCLLVVMRRSATATPLPGLWPTYGKAVVYLALGALLSSGLLYTNFLQNPGNFLEAFRSFFIYEPSAGQEKPFFAYARQLLWPKEGAGIWWTEGGVLLLAIAALLLYWRDSGRRQALGFLGIAALLHGFIYSAIAYKTPWLMLLPWAHVCLLAGSLLPAKIDPARPIRLALLMVPLLLGLGYQIKQAVAITGRLENLPYNPYGYVLTSRNVEGLGRWLQELDALQPLETIAVVGRAYWPLPWYLKDLDGEIHYWPEPVAELEAYPVVLSMPEKQAAVSAQLAESHQVFPRSLRINVPIFLHLKNENWDHWRQTDDE